MTITEALKISRQARTEAPAFECALVCGFSPLHMQTFLAAHLQVALPDSRVSIRTGLYGNVAGSLEALNTGGVAAIALPLEWSDLDPRLGYREAGAWGPAEIAGIIPAVKTMLDRIASAMERIPAGIPIAVSLPTLALPPLFHTPGWMAGHAELQLQQLVLEFALRLSAVAYVLNERRPEACPLAQRMDIKSDLAAGLPYTLPHADELAGGLAKLLVRAAPKKGLITDLDDTLWNGILGEVGPAGITWDVGSHQQIHGLYQKLLASLAEEGVLVAIASKNDAAVVDKALEREDLLLKRKHVFPVEAHWKAKSGSVDRILRTWNIGADSVVFIDDSPMELAEVAQAHPGVECIAFPKKSVPDAYRMLTRLRDIFGKPALSKEDSIRLESIRQGAAFRNQDSGDAAESFLAEAAASVTFDFDAGGDSRVRELVNKTNQFNINGIRHTEADWTRVNSKAEAFLVAVEYQDKFGPLGKIAVIRGTKQQGRLYVDVWVMSCRAFARRIEHQCLKMLFSHYDVREIVFQFQPTAKNGPTRDFFTEMRGEAPEGEFTLSRESFEQKSPLLYHRVVEVRQTVTNSN